MDQLHKKTVIVTGGTGGIGDAMCRLFANESAHVIVADVADAKGESLCAEITEAGGKATYLRLDVSNPGAWNHAAQEIRALGQLNALVNNAGIQTRSNLMDTPPETWDSIIKVNLTGAFLGIRAMAPLIREAGGGAILNISSTGGAIAHTTAAYSTSKWGLRGLTKCAAVDLARWNIRVNALLPGRIQTPFIEDADPSDLQASELIVPMKRLGKPSEVAAAALLLISDAASYITGIDMPVDGGVLAGGTVTARRHIAATLDETRRN
ncbi:SDR family NAD(P)-dependent oxidoreductase [Paraburkholderia sp. 22B1P]|uniref:SDR family NAD(P)-dependent oxidoreductase n=1 Tax=Paraburkholderia sp. 22B1P TaxID=3080498 RepID=UPI00308F3DFF|nr:SDR family NAD(P)-dependent oxidoreductase [Paraburkholderia sp. 22B1P]